MFTSFLSCCFQPGDVKDEPPDVAKGFLPRSGDTTKGSKWEKRFLQSSCPQDTPGTPAVEAQPNQRSPLLSATGATEWNTDILEGNLLRKITQMLEKNL